jgi:hypothetical protein
MKLYSANSHIYIYSCIYSYLNPLHIYIFISKYIYIFLFLYYIINSFINKSIFFEFLYNICFIFRMFRFKTSLYRYILINSKNIYIYYLIDIFIYKSLLCKFIYIFTILRLCIFSTILYIYTYLYFVLCKFI